MLEEAINQSEERGFITSTKYYESLMENERKDIYQLEKERADLLVALKDAVNSGAIREGSEAWTEMCDKINEVTLAIEEGNTALIEYDNSIRDIGWEVFDLLLDRISQITEESDFLINLMSNKKLYDDRGQMTNEGLASMGLHGVNYNTYMAEADKYAKEVERLNKEIANDPYDQELIKRREELIELQQESILNAEKEKDAIKDMVEEGINLELDALKELIDSYTDALDSAKDLNDYQKELAEKTAEIASLEKQRAAYAGDDSEENRARLQQIDSQLEEKRKDLEETEYERYISDQKELLDNLYNEYSTVLNSRLDDIDGLILDMIAEINANAGTINETLYATSESVGYTLSETMKETWDVNSSKITNVLTTYGQNIENGILSASTLLNNALNTINVNLSNMITQLNTIANTKVQSAKNSNASSLLQNTTVSNPASSKPAQSNNQQNSAQSQPTTATISGDGVPKIGDAVTFATGPYYYSSDGHAPIGNELLGKTVYIGRINSASWATKPYAIYRDKGFTMPLGWVALNQLKGYRMGKKNFANTELAWTQEGRKAEAILNPDGTITRPDGGVLTLIGKGSSVLNSDATDNIWKMANNPMDFIKDAFNNSMNNIPEHLGSSVVNIDGVEFVINAPNASNWQEIKRDVMNDNQFERFIQAITLDRAVGKSQLRKYHV